MGILRQLVGSVTNDYSGVSTARDLEQNSSNETGKSVASLPSNTPKTSDVPQEVIQQFVTPSKDIDKIRTVMETEKEPRRCAVKLLPFFFTDDELQKCNTDGSRGKPPLDHVKLNSLRGKSHDCSAGMSRHTSPQ